MASNWLFLWVSVYIKKAFNSFKGSWRKTARHVFTWRNLHVPKFRFDMKVNYSVQANSRRDISNLALHICLLLLFLLLVPLYFVWNPTLVPSPCAPRQWSMLKHKAWEWSWQNGTIAFREDNQVIFFFFLAQCTMISMPPCCLGSVFVLVFTSTLTDMKTGLSVSMYEPIPAGQYWRAGL